MLRENRLTELWVRRVEVIHVVTDLTLVRLGSEDALACVSFGGPLEGATLAVEGENLRPKSKSTARCASIKNRVGQLTFF